MPPFLSNPDYKSTANLIALTHSFVSRIAKKLVMILMAIACLTVLPSFSGLVSTTHFEFSLRFSVPHSVHRAHDPLGGWPVPSHLCQNRHIFLSLNPFGHQLFTPICSLPASMKLVKLVATLRSCPDSFSSPSEVTFVTS